MRHDDLLAVVRASRTKVPVSHPGQREGEMWHLTYVDDGLANFVKWLRLKQTLPHTLPADFVAHIPPGRYRADGYYRVETEGHWPWWWPGGGMDWTEPEDPLR